MTYVITGILVSLLIATWMGGICKSENDAINRGEDPWKKH